LKEELGDLPQQVKDAEEYVRAKSMHTEKAQVDCFITADVKYHQFHEAKGNVMLIDPGHAEMEQFVVEGMSTILQNDECLQMQFIMSDVLTSPIQHVY